MRPLTENAHDIVSVRDLFLDSGVPGFQCSSLSKEDFPCILVEDIDDFFDTLNLLPANHNLFLAIHEITHNLAFRGVRNNKLLALFANFPIGIPYSMMFKV